MRFYNASFVIGALIALATTPAAATASVTVTNAGGDMTIAGDTAADTVSIAYVFFGQPPISGDGTRVTNPAGVVPGPGCVAQSTTAAVCPEPDRTIVANLGGGVDRFTAFDYGLAALTVNGQGDNDVLGPAGGTLDGGEGDDVLLSRGYGSGNLNGGPGTDTARASEYEGYFSIGSGAAGGSRVGSDVERVEGSSSSDSFAITPGAHPGLVVVGGGGSDFASYGTHGGGITASLDDAANDGPGGGQNLIGVESLEGGGGADTLTGNGARNFLYGGPGNDRLATGGDGDSLYGGSGNDALNGGDDGDTLDGGSGSDVLRGEGGDDTVSYEDESGAVTVSLDGVANDGATGEGDDIGPDIENVFGSSGDDTITGGPGAEELNGGDGSDRIDGGGGDDEIRGGFGDDVIKGGAGADNLRGNSGDDTLDGGSGEDTVIAQDRGDDAEDVDTVELRDGEKDVAACPAGITKVFADQIDIVAATCLVERSGAPAGGPPTAQPPTAGPPPAPTGPALRVPRQRIKVDRRGVARVRVTCPKGAAPCAGVLRLVAVARKQPVIVATSVYAIPGGKARTLRVKLNKRGRALFRARKRVMRVDVTVAARVKGAPQSKVQAVKLRRG